MNARATRGPRGGAGRRPSGRSTGRNTKGPTNGCAVVILAAAGTLLAALGEAAHLAHWL